MMMRMMMMTTTTTTLNLVLKMTAAGLVMESLGVS
jgi:hypothetical protein